jgi:hypothetical protein
MKRLIATILVLSAFAVPALAEDYDLVINNGRVMDPETMLDATMNVGVKDGRIAKITADAITGTETIDATGLVVAPGFIDTHFHSVDPFGMKLAARNGVTSPLDMEAGVWNVAAYYDAKDGKWPLNYGATVSHERARMIVLDGMNFDGPTDALTAFQDRAKSLDGDNVAGWSTVRPNLDQLNEISRLMDEQMRQGAIGASSLVGYARSGVTTYELYEFQRVAARYGRVAAAHQRFHGNVGNPQAALGFDEMFTNAVVLDGPLMMCHDNDQDWWEIEEKLAIARKKGMNMWSEYYPYAAASSNVGAEYLAPEIFEDNMHYSYKDQVYDPSQDKYLSKEEVLQLRKDDPGRTIVIQLPPRKAWLPLWLRMPHMTVASDAMWMDGGRDADFPFEDFKGHPRTAGSHAAVLRMGRENGVPLMFTLSQLSYWSAKHLGDTGLKAMQERGRMQEGMVADITIFDPETVTDHATFKDGENGLPSTGIPYVLVSGVPVVRDSVFQKDVFPGQPVRFPVEEKGRFEPISPEKFVGIYSINVPSLPIDDAGIDEETHKRFGSMPKD